MTIDTSTPDAKQVTAWTFEVSGRPISLNQERGEHWSKRAAEVARVLHEAFWLAKEQKIPQLDQVRIVAVPIYPTQRRRDPGNAYPTLKAIIDGLVAAKVLKDDSDAHVVEIVMRRSEIRPGGIGGMRVQVEEVVG